MPWTRLGATADVGDNQIVLESPVDWAVGDQIVIATSGHRHSQRQNEVRNITHISADNMTLTLDETLDYKHLGETVQLYSGKNLPAKCIKNILFIMQSVKPFVKFQ